MAWMRRIGLGSSAIGLAAAGWIGCDGPGGVSRPENVFGADGRRIITARDFPYSTIGRLDTGCTATLVGKRLAVTAAHCVYDGTGQRVPPQLGYLSLAVVNGQPSERVWIQRVWFGTDKPDQERGKDWALLLLEGEPGTRNRWMGVRVVDFAASLPYAVSVTGYSSDINNGNSMSSHEGCYIFRVNGERLLNECDSTAGISGGPVYTMTQGQPSIVGLAVSEYRQGSPGSTHPDTWSEASSNVAIGAISFQPTLDAIQRALDAGTALPSLADVNERANPNSPSSVGTGAPISTGTTIATATRTSVSTATRTNIGTGTSPGGGRPECQLPPGVDPSQIYPPLPAYCFQ